MSKLVYRNNVGSRSNFPMPSFKDTKKCNNEDCNAIIHIDKKFCIVCRSHSQNKNVCMWCGGKEENEKCESESEFHCSKIIAERNMSRSFSQFKITS